jgi:hypothetical protein
VADRHSSLRTLRIVYLVDAVTPLVWFTAAAPEVLVLAAVAESLVQTGPGIVWMLAVIEFAGRRPARRCTGGPAWRRTPRTPRCTARRRPAASSAGGGRGSVQARLWHRRCSPEHRRAPATRSARRMR